MFPKIKVARFDKLAPGELFVLFESGKPCFAIKTEALEETSESEMVLLGPTFPEGITEATVTKWQAATVVSYGTDFTVFLPQTPSAWFKTGETRTSVCLAISGDDVFVCANGANYPPMYLQCFINLKTGALIERNLSQISAFTKTWEIAVTNPNLPPISLLKY